MVLFVLLVLLPLTLLGIYGVAAWQERKRSRWSGWRIASYACGTVLLITAMLPPVAPWAYGSLRGHMAQHLLLGMIAPLGLVLGAPGTLLLRHCSVETGRRIVSVLATLPLRVLTHPVTAALLDIGGMYLLYLTPLYALSLHDPVLHALIHIHFVLAGYLFTWSIIGPDPAPHRPGRWTRLGVLLLAGAAHAILGKLMYAHLHPRGTGASPNEIRDAAQWMYYGGDVAELLLALAFFAFWRGRGAPIPDRRGMGRSASEGIAK